MSSLPFQIERYIVKQLACDEAPEAIADQVQNKFLRDVEAGDVRAYCPDADGAALTPDLRDLYQFTRWQYQGADEESAEQRSYVTVATTEEVQDEALHCVDVKDRTIVLVHRDGEYAALDNRCTHQGGPLCEGEVSDDTLTCPWHGGAFEIGTGAPTNPPAVEAVETYDLRVEGGEIEVKV